VTDTSPEGGAGKIAVFDNPRERFYELRVDGTPAGELVYETSGSQRVLTHTVVREDFRGRGLSKVLIRAALDDLGSKDVTVTNRCPAVSHFIETNPQYAEVVTS
jgi:predicted GNAT family acetyltransferase